MCRQAYGPPGTRPLVRHRHHIRQNEHKRNEHFDEHFDEHKRHDKAENRGFRMKNGRMMTYEQHKLGLSAYYDKRWVLPDGIHTEHIEYHI